MLVFSFQLQSPYPCLILPFPSLSLLGSPLLHDLQKLFHLCTRDHLASVTYFWSLSLVFLFSFNNNNPPTLSNKAILHVGTRLPTAAVLDGSRVLCTARCFFLVLSGFHFNFLLTSFTDISTTRASCCLFLFFSFFFSCDFRPPSSHQRENT